MSPCFCGGFSGCSWPALSPAHALPTRLLHPSRGINSPPPAGSSSSRDSQGTALVLGHVLEMCPRHPPPPGLSSQLPGPTCSLCGPLYGSLSGPVLSWWQSPGKTPISHQAVARGPSLTSPPTCVPGCWSCSSLCFLFRFPLFCYILLKGMCKLASAN